MMYELQVAYLPQQVYYQQSYGGVAEPQYPGWPENSSGGYENYNNSNNNGWVEEAKTSQLLQEFEDVLSRQLTPPDSPQISPSHQHPAYYSPILHLQPTPQEQSSPQPSPSHQHHYQPVSSTESVNEFDAIVADSFGNGDCTSSSDSGYEDPDWAPISAKSRNRPYPSLEERKARKKEQNKNAATRYRQKKKQEIEVILSEERELQEKNESLKAEVEEVQREIKYLKSLMRHMFKAKGIIS